jgi:hypothetical protein
MTRSLCNFQYVSPKTAVLLKHPGVGFCQRRWPHTDHQPSATKVLDNHVSMQTVLAPEVPMASLKKFKQPRRTALPGYLRDIWTMEETWHLAELQTKGTKILCLLRPSMVPRLREELWKRHSNIMETQTLVITSQEIKAIISEKEIRRKLKDQLQRCQTTKDIFRVVAAALQSKRIANHLASMVEPIIQAFYRARAHSSDLTISTKIYVLIRRFEREGLRLMPRLFSTGLTYAFRSRNLKIVKRFLWEFRSRNLDMGRSLVRLLIAKCSIGSRGFGEIRNGRWNRRDLIQILLGFHDSPPGEEYHLGSFINRDDWQQMCAWLQILSRCGLREQILKEWEYWKQSPARKEDRPLIGLGARSESVRVRGDRAFVHELIVAGDYRRAWKVLAETGLNPKCLSRERLHTLLSWADLATVWNEDLRNELLVKYEEDLSAVEHFLGVEWVSDGNGGGYHKPTERLEEALEELSEENFFGTFGLIGEASDE